MALQCADMGHDCGRWATGVIVTRPCLTWAPRDPHRALWPGETMKRCFAGGAKVSAQNQLPRQTIVSPRVQSETIPPRKTGPRPVGWHALRYSEGRGLLLPRPSEYLRACHTQLAYYRPIEKNRTPGKPDEALSWRPSPIHHGGRSSMNRAAADRVRQPPTVRLEPVGAVKPHYRNTPEIIVIEYCIAPVSIIADLRTDLEHRVKVVA